MMFKLSLISNFKKTIFSFKFWLRKLSKKIGLVQYQEKTRQVKYNDSIDFIHNLTIITERIECFIFLFATLFTVLYNNFVI